MIKPLLPLSLATIAFSTSLTAWAGPPEGTAPGDGIVTIEAPAEPAAEGPAAEGPAAEGPAAETPVAEAPVAEAPVVEPPAPVVEAPAEHAPAEPEPATLRNATIGSEVAVTDAKYKIGKGFSFASKDGRFSIQVRGRVQLRYDFEHPNVEGEPIDHVAQLRRVRLVLMGNVFSPNIKYHFQFGFSPRDMTNDLPSDPTSIRRNPLRDARIEFDRIRDFNVWVGQFKVPFSRQRVLSSSNMNMVDRSIVNADFNLDRDIGIEAFSKDVGGLGHKLAYYVGVFMGEGRNAFELSDPGLLYVARFEVNPFGKFDDYVEGDLARSNKPGLSIGAAYAFQDRAHPARGVVGDAPADGGTTDFHHATADVMFKLQGFSLLAGAHLRRGFNRVNGGAVDDMGVAIPTVAARSGLAWYAQAGYLVPKIPLEFVARYGMIRKFEFAGDPSSQRNADEAGVGINYYFVGHDLKLQLDYFRLWDETMGVGYADQAKHGTDRIRLQLQVYF